MLAVLRLACMQISPRHSDTQALKRLSHLIRLTSTQTSPLHTQTDPPGLQKLLCRTFILLFYQTFITRSPEKHEFMSIENLKTFGELFAQPTPHPCRHTCHFHPLKHISCDIFTFPPALAPKLLGQQYPFTDVKVCTLTNT